MIRALFGWMGPVSHKEKRNGSSGCSRAGMYLHTAPRLNAYRTVVSPAPAIIQHNLTDLNHLKNIFFSLPVGQGLDTEE